MSELRLPLFVVGPEERGGASIRLAVAHVKAGDCEKEEEACALFTGEQAAEAFVLHDKKCRVVRLDTFDALAVVLREYQAQGGRLIVLDPPGPGPRQPKWSSWPVDFVLESLPVQQREPKP